MLNITILQGRFVAQPELKQLNEKTSLCDVTIAWNEKYGQTEKQCFMRCKFWNKTAEFVCNYFEKGDQILVEGKLNTESWDKDGQKQSMIVLNVNQCHFCGSKQENMSNNASIQVQQTPIQPTQQQTMQPIPMQYKQHQNIISTQVPAQNLPPQQIQTQLQNNFVPPLQNSPPVPNIVPQQATMQPPQQPVPNQQGYVLGDYFEASEVAGDDDFPY